MRNRPEFEPADGKEERGAGMRKHQAGETGDDYSLRPRQSAQQEMDCGTCEAKLSRTCRLSPSAGLRGDVAEEPSPRETIERKSRHLARAVAQPHVLVRRRALQEIHDDACKVDVAHHLERRGCLAQEAAVRQGWQCRRQVQLNTIHPRSSTYSLASYLAVRRPGGARLHLYGEKKQTRT